MEGSRRDPRKNFRKETKESNFPEVLWMEDPAKSLWELFFLIIFDFVLILFYGQWKKRVVRMDKCWEQIEAIKLKKSSKKIIKNATYILKG